MVQTATDIANMALTFVGANPISNIIDSRAPEAYKIRAFYDISRRAELELFDWSFARRFRSLASASVNPASLYAYAYILPEDCLAPRGFEPPATKTVPKPYELVQNDSGQRLILTNELGAILRYTFDQTDTLAYTTNFALAVSHRLASYIAYSSTNKQTVREAELLLAKEARDLAQANDGNTAQEEGIEPVAEWHIVRGVVAAGLSDQRFNPGGLG